jgi:hypothetical protein
MAKSGIAQQLFEKSSNINFLKNSSSVGADAHH